MTKRKLTLLVDESLISKGKSLGLNLSRYFETQIENFIQNSSNLSKAMKNNGTRKIKEICGGPDSNRRTPTGMDPESIAFNLARQPPQSNVGLICNI